ncbi:MAG: PfkB family carbohydrate kinase, partial [Clostridiales bacterium]|nr:PfkB family carbohydrate kinase [Clostridiales bacterium]
VLVDPIMADGGRLYNGIGEERVDALRRLAALSDVMVPNMTEASFLTGIRPGQETGTPEEIRELVDGLHGISQGSVVITSAFDTESGQHVVSGYDHRNRNYFTVPYEYIPVRVAGSGDIFSAVMTGELLRGKMLSEAVKKAVRVLTEMIRADQVCQHEYRWISVERYLDRFPDYGV